MHAALLERLLGQYRPEHVSDFSQITVGVSNDAYVVATTSGNRYVIRVIHLQTTESVEAEALIQQAMIRHRLSTPVYLRLDDGRFVGRDGDIRFTIAEYVSGSHPGSVTLGLVRSLGATLARLHDVLDPAEIRLGLNTGQWLHRRNAATDIATCHAPIRHGLQSAFDESAHIYELGLPTAIIHGELATNNVFAEGDRVTTIFDFETARHAPRLLKVAYTYLSVVYDGVLPPTEALQLLRTGYDREARAKLTADENEQFGVAVHYVSTATAAWCFSRGYAEYDRKFTEAGAQEAGASEPVHYQRTGPS